MINRVLIRVKVVQMLYSYQLTQPERTFAQALNDLDTSFQWAYDLYLYLLKLVPELTYLQERNLDDAKNKFMPTDEDLNPNTRFVDNYLPVVINNSEQLSKLFRDRHIAWNDDPIFLRTLLDKIVHSETYHEYMSQYRTNQLRDCDLWRNLLRKVILVDESLAEQFELRSLYLSEEDLDIMGQFAIKTIGRIGDGNPDYVMPMFKDEEDSAFGRELFAHTVQDMSESNKLIDSLLVSDRWDATRVALMDRIIMCVAIAEMKHFEKIPAEVTLNEYITLAKMFSTPNSGQFVNGILNVVAREMGLLAEKA